MLLPETRLGHYQIVAPLGSGGMGEVYRGRDTRIGRDVAIKVLPAEFAADPERLRRFEHEARATGALNHPNLLTLYDLGAHDGIAYLVTELLEGETLRSRLAGGALPLKKALDYGVQIARGLAAAHERGVVHRDLKPENLFLTRDGRVKILDFGLARLDGAGRGDGPESTTLTTSGVILGTAGYMAPEQVRGERADARADLFALGCVLYEMVSGQRAFHGATAVETMSAILNAEPTPLAERGHADLPAGLEPVVRHCLEKDPAQRFQSAGDLAFALGSLSPLRDSSRARAAARPGSRRWAALSAGALAILITGAVAGVLVAGARRPSPPTFERLTARRGSIDAARYAPDGRTVVYSASWDGQPGRIYTTRVDSRESSPLPLPDARLLAVSSAGELAIAVGPGFHFGVGLHTTLARVPLAGGAPREVLDNVSEADWSPDGASLAAVTDHPEVTGTATTWLEYPLGHKLYASSTGLVTPRVSPRGDQVALVEMESSSDYTRGSVIVVDRTGHVRKLTPVWNGIQGIAWSPRGDEVLYTAVQRGSAKALHAVSLSGHDRLVFNAPGALTVRDALQDGRVLITHDDERISTVARAGPADRERDLSWQESTGAADISDDGRTLLFTEWGEAAGAAAVVGLRGTDGSPVVKLGDGYAGGLSPDGKWALAILLGGRPHLSLLPTGPGQARDLDPGPVRDIGWSCFAPNGRQVVFSGTEPGQAARPYVQDLAGGPPRAIGPEGVEHGWHMVSPDSRFLLGSIPTGPFLFPLAGGAPLPVRVLRPQDAPVHWSPDGRSILIRRDWTTLPARIERVDLATGAEEPVCSLLPTDPAGVTQIAQILFTPDARAYAYSFTRQLSDLYEARGLR